MKTFSREVKALVNEAQNGYCIVAGCYNRIHSFHHIVHNTRANQKRFPLFLPSVINCVGVCEHHHSNWTLHKELNCIDEKKAKIIEEFLRQLKVK